MPNWHFERISSKRISQDLRCDNLKDARLARGHQRIQSLSNLLRSGHFDTLSTHGLGNLSKAGINQIGSNEPIGIEIHLVLFLSTPLVVVKNDGNGWDVFTDASQHFVQAHAPGPVSDVGNAGPFWGRDFGSHSTRKGIATITEAHGCEKGPRLVKTKVAVGYGADIANICGHHGILKSA